MDPILYWNEVALDANRNDFSKPNGGSPEQGGPTLSSRALAIVHIAMYDAYAGVINDPVKLPLYLGMTSVAGASADAAVAAAAHATLSKLYPSQKAFFDLKHAGAGLGSGASVQDGHNFGFMIAQKLLDLRKNDPSADDAGYAASSARGKHRPDPDNPSPSHHAPFYGEQSQVFAVTKKWELAAPPLDNNDYENAVKQVRGLGIAPDLMGTLPDGHPQRTVDQTLIGIYWGYDGAFGLGTPPRLYNQIIRSVAMEKEKANPPAVQTANYARLFALVNAAMGDAGILAWREKYRFNFWRPVVGIREHDISMGPSGQPNNNIDNDCDPLWLPLGAPKTNEAGKKNFTPNFPAYPSGHATFGGAALHMTRLFYGVPVGNTAKDSLFNGLSFVSDEFNGVNTDNKGAIRPRHVRKFTQGLLQMIEENGLSRIYLGVHWSFDAFALKNGKPDLTNKKLGGVPLGIKIAEDIFTNGLVPRGIVPPMPI